MLTVDHAYMQNGSQKRTAVHVHGFRDMETDSSSSSSYGFTNYDICPYIFKVTLSMLHLNNYIILICELCVLLH